MSNYRRPVISGFYVYQYVRTFASEHGPAGSPYYIGKGHGLRAYKKNPIEAIRTPKDKSMIVIIAKDLSEDEAFFMEKQLIKFHGRINLGTGCLRNRTDGGEGGSGAVRTAEMKAKVSAVHKGLRHTAEAIAKMIKSRTGSKRSEETKARMSASFRGRKLGPMSEEEKAKRSAALKGRPKPQGFSEKISAANRRRKLSEESKAKISRSLTGKKASEETRAKQSAIRKGRVPGNKGMKHKEETKAKMSALLKERWERGDYDNRKKRNTSSQCIV